MLITCDAIESNALQRDYLQQVIESHFSNSEYIYLIYMHTLKLSYRKCMKLITVYVTV